VAVVPPRSMPTKSSCRCASCGPPGGQRVVSHGWCLSRAAFVPPRGRRIPYSPTLCVCAVLTGCACLCGYSHAVPRPAPLAAPTAWPTSGPRRWADNRPSRLRSLASSGIPTYRRRHCCMLNCCTVTHRTSHAAWDMRCNVPRRSCRRAAAMRLPPAAPTPTPTPTPAAEPLQALRATGRRRVRRSPSPRPQACSVLRA
jgi:hypothetical protein